MFYALCLAHWQVTESETLKIWRTSSMKKNKLELTDKEYDEVIDYAIDLGVENAFIQEGDVAKDSFIPDFDTLLGV